MLAFMLTFFFVLFVQTLPSTWFEAPAHGKSGGWHRREQRHIHTTFIKSQRMSEILDTVASTREGQSLRDETHRTDGIPVYKRILDNHIRLLMENTYQTPTNSIVTLIEKAFLNALLFSQPCRSLRLYMWYAKGTC